MNAKNLPPQAGLSSDTGASDTGASDTGASDTGASSTGASSGEAAKARPSATRKAADPSPSTGASAHSLPSSEGALSPSSPSSQAASTGTFHNESDKGSSAHSPVDLNAFSPRERILAAALKLFVEQGYFNTNVPDLSRESKCSVGSIYHTFKNKEEVASALYAESIRAFRQALERAIRPCNDTEVLVKTLVRSLMEFSEINHQVSRYIWLCRHNEFMTGIIKHPTTVGFDGLGRALTRAVRKGVREGKIRKIPANVLWSVLFGIPLAYVRDWLDGYNAAAPRKVADEIAVICWRALQP